MNEYRIGDYGEFEFTHRTNGSYKGYFKGRAEIIEIDGQNIKLIDNDKFVYRTIRSKITMFKPKDKKKEQY